MSRHTARTLSALVSFVLLACTPPPEPDLQLVDDDLLRAGDGDGDMGDGDGDMGGPQPDFGIGECTCLLGDTPLHGKPCNYPDYEDYFVLVEENCSEVQYPWCEAQSGCVYERWSCECVELQVGGQWECGVYDPHGDDDLEMRPCRT